MSKGPYADRVSKWRADNVDFSVALAAGKFPGWSVLHKFGSNPAVGTVIEDVWAIGGAYVFPSTASLLEVFSTEAGDTILGTGARTIEIQGLDATGAEQSEIIELDGVGVVSSAKSYLRVSRAFILTAGTYSGGAAGDIEIRITGAGASQGIILHTYDAAAWNLGQTTLGRYSVPLGKTAFLRRLEVENEASKDADIFVYQKKDILNVTDFTAPRVFKIFAGVSGGINVVFEAPVKLDQLTDIFAKAAISSGSGKITLTMEILLYDGVI